MKLLQHVFFIFILYLFSNCTRSTVSEVDTKSTPFNETTTDVEIIFSDSAKVKAKLNTPLLIYKKDIYCYEMPKGVKILFYDSNVQVVSSVESDYAIRKEKEHLTELRNNVIIKNQKGEKFLSEEFIWNENEKKFISNQPVTIITEGTKLTGTNFWSNENFSVYHIKQSRGNFSIKD